jgi:hypothetical protein
MKRTILVISFLIIVCVSFSQVRKEVAFKYLEEFGDVFDNYKDVIITNVDDKPWPAVGVYKIEKSFYYFYTNYHGETLRMISEDNYISAMRFSKYYIYDDYQNLKYFIYQCENCGELIMKFNGDAFEVVKTSDNIVLNENYFIDIDDEFSPFQILKAAKTNLAYCEILWGLPDYQDETENIRKRFKEVNSMDNLIERRNENIIGYYNDDELVKITVKDESNRDYYLEDGLLIFAFYPKTDDVEDIRVYFSGDAFKVILGKDNLPKTEFEFHEIAGQVKEDYNDAIIKL